MTLALLYKGLYLLSHLVHLQSHRAQVPYEICRLSMYIYIMYYNYTVNILNLYIIMYLCSRFVLTRGRGSLHEPMWSLPLTPIVV